MSIFHKPLTDEQFDEIMQSDISINGETIDIDEIEEETMDETQRIVEGGIDQDRSK